MVCVNICKFLQLNQVLSDNLCFLLWNLLLWYSYCTDILQIFIWGLCATLASTFFLNRSTILRSVLLLPNSHSVQQCLWSTAWCFSFNPFLTSNIKFNFTCLHYNLDAITMNGYWMLRCNSLLHTTYMQLWAFSLYSCLDTSLNVWNLVESLRTEVFRVHLGHCKYTQNNKHWEEMLGIYHYDEQCICGWYHLCC